MQENNTSKSLKTYNSKTNSKSNKEKIVINEWWHHKGLKLTMTNTLKTTFLEEKRNTGQPNYQ